MNGGAANGPRLFLANAHLCGQILPSTAVSLNQPGPTRRHGGAKPVAKRRPPYTAYRQPA